MADSSKTQAARWIPLLVIGMSLNTLGIVLQSLGWPRFLLMGVGILLLLVALLKLLSLAEDAPDPSR